MALLYLNTLQNLTLFGGNRLAEAIHELNTYYPSELIVYLEFGDGSDILEESKPPLTQTLWFKSPPLQAVIEGNFSSCTLTVLYLEDKTIESGINYLTNWLWKYHHLHVIIFYKDGTIEGLNNMFRKCFNQGLHNLLVILPEFQGVYTFQPFPEVRIIHLNSVKEYSDRSLLKWNLLGHNVTIGLVTAGAPRWFSFRDRHNKLILTGYMLRSVVDFTNNFNGTIDLVDVKTVNEGLELLANRSIDFFPFLIRPLETFSMTSILYLESCGLIVPSSRLLPNFLYLSRPYTFTTWITWLIMLAYCSLALRILYKGQVSLSETFLHILRLALYLSGGKAMGARPSHHRFVLFFILTHSGFILTNLYLAKLSSNLAAGLYEKQINTWDDLDKSDSIWPLIDVDVETMQKLIPDRKNLIKRIVTTPELDG